MRFEITSRFPPGEVGKRFNMIPDLEDGEFVYVRMQVRRAEPSDTGAISCKLVMPNVSDYAFQVVMVAQSQIICREPKAMEADQGIVIGIG